MFRGFGSRKLQTSANVPVPALAPRAPPPPPPRRAIPPPPPPRSAPVAPEPEPVAPEPEPASVAPVAPVKKSSFFGRFASTPVVKSNTAPSPTAPSPNAPSPTVTTPTAPSTPKLGLINKLRYGTANKRNTAKNSANNAALLYAAQKGDVKTVESLAPRVTDKTTLNKAIIAAAGMPSRACVHALVQRFEDSMNDIRDKQNGTLMHVAVLSLMKYKAVNNSKVNTVVSIINNILDDLKGKIDVNAKDSNGDTVLHLLTRSRSKGSNSLLLHILEFPSVDVNLSNNAGEKAIDLLYKTNLTKRNSKGVNMLFPKEQVAYKMASALTAKGANGPKQINGSLNSKIYQPLMTYYNSLNTKKANNIQKIEVIATTKEAAELAAAKAEALAAAAAQDEAATAQKAAANAAAKAQAAQKAAAARAAAAKQASAKALANAATKKAALAPKPKGFFGLGGRRTRKNRKH